MKSEIIEYHAKWMMNTINGINRVFSDCFWFWAWLTDIIYQYVLT